MEQTPSDKRSPEVNDERAATAPEPGPYGWADDFLSHVPFEDLNIGFLTHLCEMLNRVTSGPQASAAVLRSLPREDGNLDEEERADAVARIEEGDFSVLREYSPFFGHQEIGSKHAHLYGYARGGEGPGHNPEQSRVIIQRLIDDFGDLEEKLSEPVQKSMGAPLNWLLDTVAAARARWAIDNGKPVAPDDLAALGGVRPKTIANLLASKSLPVDAHGMVPAAPALVWLSGRSGFVQSGWQSTDMEEASPKTLVEGSPRLSEQVFIPVDGDGGPFLPSLARRSKLGVLRFAIGDKSSPEFVEDYWDALDRLTRMPVPRWRRPNPGGHGAWGLVSGQEKWARYSRTDLDRMIESARSGRD